MTTTTDAAITVLPANEVPWQQLRLVFGERGEASRCYCQWFKVRDFEWDAIPVEQHAQQLRDQTGCDDPSRRHTSGLVAFLDSEPVGWCAVEPRSAYPRLAYTRVPWAGREEDRADASVWAVTCFVTRTGYRRRGVSRALARAAVDFARERGAHAVEGYPKILAPGKAATWGELYVGTPTIFEDAGFTEVSRPTLRRAVMRIDF